MSGTELEEPGVLAYRVRMVEAAVLELRASQESIAASLQQLVRLEERHAETRESLGRAFTTIGKNTDRIASIERDLPTLKLITGWVVVLMLGCVAAVGALVWKRAIEPDAAPVSPRAHATPGPVDNSGARVLSRGEGLAGSQTPQKSISQRPSSAALLRAGRAGTSRSVKRQPWNTV